MWVKICGITQVPDARAAADAGADAIGLNFVGGPRRLDVSAARSLLASLPALVTPVALVRLQDGRIDPAVIALLTEHRVTHLQLYGDTDSGALAALRAGGFRPIPVLAVKDAAALSRIAEWARLPAESAPAAAVVDAYDPSQEGGTGRTFRWDWLRDAAADQRSPRLPVILAGGLTPENVAEAVRTTRPYGVDVSSGVELPGRPGHKDPAKMAAFVRNARTAACEVERNT